MLGLCHIHRRIESQERKSAAGLSLAKPRLRHSREAPFSVVFTDWLSMMAPPSASSGVGGIPSLALPDHGAQCLLNPLQVPSLRHFRKCHQTVSQGGRSWGIIHQGMPPRKTYSMPLIPPAGPRYENGPWVNPGATRVPEGPIGHRLNQWDMIFGSYTPTYTQPTHDIKPY